MKTTKKIISLLISVLIIFSLSVCSFADDNVISVYVDDKKVEFDVQPQIIGGRTMVPLRAIFESLGATVSWNEETRTVTAYNITTVVKATIDSNIISVNYIDKAMDVAPMIINDRTFVPARFIAEAFGCDVEWDGSSKTVYISSKPVDYDDLEKDTDKEPIKPSNDKGSHKENNYNTNTSYYPETNIPTYTSVTGIRCFDTATLNDGSPVYMYRYTTAEDVGNYWGVLLNKGWSFFKDDDVTTSSTYESSLIKGNKFIIINVYLNSNEVWITYN